MLFLKSEEGQIGVIGTQIIIKPVTSPSKLVLEGRRDGGYLSVIGHQNSRIFVV